jgi:hypothetical protein
MIYLFNRYSAQRYKKKWIVNRERLTHFFYYWETILYNKILVLKKYFLYVFEIFQ